MESELDILIQVYIANRMPSYLSAESPSLRHIILKLSDANGKERVLKASGG